MKVSQHCTAPETAWASPPTTLRHYSLLILFTVYPRSLPKHSSSWISERNSPGFGAQVAQDLNTVTATGRHADRLGCAAAQPLEPSEEAAAAACVDLEKEGELSRMGLTSH